MLYTFLRAQPKQRMRVAVILSGNCAPIADKKTLYVYMYQLELVQHEKAKISQRDHRFGTTTTAYKTTAAVRVAIIIDPSIDTGCMKFYIIFDITYWYLRFCVSLQPP